MRLSLIARDNLLLNTGSCWPEDENLKMFLPSHWKLVDFCLSVLTCKSIDTDMHVRMWLLCTLDRCSLIFNVSHFMIFANYLFFPAFSCPAQGCMYHTFSSSKLACIPCVGSLRKHYNGPAHIQSVQSSCTQLIERCYTREKRRETRDKWPPSQVPTFLLLSKCIPTTQTAEYCMKVSVKGSHQSYESNERKQPFRHLMFYSFICFVCCSLRAINCASWAQTEKKADK